VDLAEARIGGVTPENLRRISVPVAAGGDSDLDADRRRYDLTHGRRHPICGRAPLSAQAVALCARIVRPQCRSDADELLSRLGGAPRESCTEYLWKHRLRSRMRGGRLWWRQLFDNTEFINTSAVSLNLTLVAERRGRAPAGAVAATRCDDPDDAYVRTRSHRLPQRAGYCSQSDGAFIRVCGSRCRSHTDIAGEQITQIWAVRNPDTLRSWTAANSCCGPDRARLSPPR
jgi:hypothetical protein